ncbi:RHS repeat-associated core domain-containing protein, partial [Halomonas sp. ATBC28]|uniref:RHS repeat-associated core domain-containing protein n=1 Tax=Halomonas sp. ATBC28 TaxID=2545264 RepID=UPI0024B5342D
SELGATREATYRYDGLGRRISKTVRHTNGTTATTHYGWDGDRIVREETDNQRTTVVYEPGSFVPMMRIDDTQQGQVLSAYITDALGTPMQLVTPNGQPRWLAEPDDWAAVKNQRAVRNVTQPIRFQGQWHDEESGLYYNRHRYYDPQQGRYINQDPIGLRGGTNLYGYVTNPTGMVDPLGLVGECNLEGPADEGFIAKIWRNSTAWHFEGRHCRNTDLPSFKSANSRNSDWILLPESQSIFHDNGIGKPELKFIHPDGREAVFDGDTHELITDPRYMGTYNYVNPSKTPEEWTDFRGWGDWAIKGVGHGVLDVLPYIPGRNNVRGPN